MTTAHEPRRKPKNPSKSQPLQIGDLPGPPRLAGHRPPPGVSSRRCSAKRSTDGKPCEGWAVYGTTVCMAHGASSSRVRNAAAEETLQAHARLLLERWRAEPHPLEAAVAELAAEGGPVDDLAAFLAESVGPPARTTPDDAERVLAELEAEAAAGRLQAWPGLPVDPS